MSEAQSAARARQTPQAREAAIGAVLEAIVSISRGLGTARRPPFADVHLTATQLDALFLVAHSRTPLTPGALASRLQVTPGAVTQLVDGLIELGLVQRQPNPNDARSRLLTLTDQAAVTVAAFESEVIARMASRFESLSDAELAALAATLSRVETRP